MRVGRGIAAAAVVASLLSTAAGVEIVSQAPPAQAAVLSASTEVTYKEYWVPHTQFTGNCDSSTGGLYYIEPGPCEKNLTLNIPDNFANADRAEIYLDLWRNRTVGSMRFRINGGPWREQSQGADYSRKPYTTAIPLTELVQGNNTITFGLDGDRLYHLHDAAIRIYYTPTKPLVAGPGSDVTPPTGALNLVTANGQSFAAAAGGTLQVDNNQIGISATGVSGAKYVEFHAYYTGYDEDNDGQMTDWHNFNRNNWNPGGLTPQTTGGTIGHMGSDATSPYSVTWSLPHVANQSGVRFKLRVVDTAGNVREAAGGQSGSFTLTRNYSVDTYRITNFSDAELRGVAGFDSSVTRIVNLPTDLDISSVSAAYLLGNHWNSPLVSINDNASFSAFQGTEDVWTTSRRQLTVSQLKPGANEIRYTYNPASATYGQFVEKPGPMIVLHRTAPSGTTAVTTHPKSQSINEGSPVTFSITATGTAPLSYQWTRNGSPILGATGSSYTLASVTTADHGAQFAVTVSGTGGTAVSEVAVLTVIPIGAAVGPWWDTQWDYRVPITVDPGPYQRSNRMVVLDANFSSLMTSAGQGAVSFDPTTIRIVEVDAAGTVIDTEVPHQFDQGTGYNALTNAVGQVVFLTEGTTNAYSLRYYHLYFDRTGKGITPLNVTSQVSLTQNVTDAGFNSHRITTPNGTWYYHTAGGGFSSLIDSQGNDWISYSTASGAAGDFRGIPNAVPPSAGGYFHPGRTTSTTTVVGSGPLRVTLQSSAGSGAYVTRWEIYPTHAEMRMTAHEQPYWFLYEGTPGGTANGATDMVVRSDGTTTPLNTAWTADMANEEFVFFTDQATSRSLFAANSVNDGQSDTSSLMNNVMTVFGFGRSGARASLNSTTARYTVGLLNSTDYNTNRPSILSTSRDITARFGLPSYDGTFSGPYSDAFNLSSLDPRWTVSDPRGTTTISLDGSRLQLAMPGGQTRNHWTAQDFAPRLLQPAPNTDMDLMVKFDSQVTASTTFQGLLVQESQGNNIRFSITRIGTSTRIQAVSLVNGTGTVKMNKYITAPGGPVWIRVTRAGDAWTVRWSKNGTTFTSLGSVNHVLNVTAAGVIAGTHGSGANNAPAFTAIVDFFQNLGQPGTVGDSPVISNVVVDPGARRATITFDTNELADGFIDYGPTVALGSTIAGALDATSHSIELLGLTCNTTYHFRARGVDVDNLTGTSLTTTFSTDPCPVLTSDDFSSTTLNPLWSFVNPVGDATLSLNGTQAVISIPAGVDHNMWSAANRAPRLVQEAPEGDFEMEAKFETAVTSRYQMMGMVMQLDENDFLRFEVHHNGTGWRAFAGNVVNDVGTAVADTAFPYTPGPATYLRVTRAGLNWTFQVSVDGLAWTTVTTVSRNFNPTFVGPYVGATANTPAQTPAFTAAIDYAFNTASPIDPEDGTGGSDTTDPVISNVQVTQTSQRATFTWTTDEPASSAVDFGLVPPGGTTVSQPALVTNHSLTTGILNCGTPLNYRIRSSDAAGNEAETANATFTTPACNTALESDDFSGAVVNARWAERDPLNVGTVSLLTGTALRMQIPAGNPSDIAGSTNHGLRLTQTLDNSDFSAEIKFESPVNQRSQIQGLVFEQNDNNLVRFDMSYNGSAVVGFIGKYTNGSTLTAWKNTTIPLTAPSYLRVARTGTTWTFDYSTDGTNWTNFHVQTGESMPVYRVGPWIGTKQPPGQGAASAPGFISQIDYFFNSNSPIVPEDGGVPGPNPSVFNLYHGTTQKFGNVGRATSWVNILGEVTDVDGMSSLSYTLNNGPLTALSFGYDTRRLVNPGAFNVDIPRASMLEGPNTVLLRAVDTLGFVTTQAVTVNYTSTVDTPIPYTIDWDTVTDIQDVAEVVDGDWDVVSGTLQNQDIGYDRLVAIGDDSWTDYEIRFPFTVHSVNSAGYAAPNFGPGIGAITHWNGHTSSNSQPNWGYIPLGAMAAYRWKTNAPTQSLQLMDNNGVVRSTNTLTVLQLNTEYQFRMQTVNGPTGPTTRAKFWPTSQPEPTIWSVEYTDGPTAPTSGGALIVAHHVDATFGDIQVLPVVLDPAAAPVINPAGGTFTGQAPNVTMSSSTPGATIYYTVDGNEPTITSTQYTGPINITSTATVKAKAFANGFAASATTSVDFIINPSVRALDQVQVIYDFANGSGTVVSDLSGNPVPLDLVVESGSNVTWGAGFITLNTASRLRTAVGATRVRDAIQASNEFTYEVWAQPANNTQNSVLMTMSANTTGRNMTITQVAAQYRGALRTASTTTAGSAIQMPASTVATTPALDHIVVTRDAAGLVTWYLNGVFQGSSTVAGALSNWDTYRITLGSENGGTLPWLGQIHYAAIYSKALNATEVQGNFTAGASL